MAGNGIGSVSVDVVPNADGFWREFVARTQPGAAEAGRKLGAEIRRGVQGELSRDVKVGVKADTSQARAEIAALNKNGSRDSGALLKNLLALSPALVPLGAAAGAAGAEFAALGAVGILAITGIKKEIEAATPNGAAFSGIVQQVKGDLGQLQGIASAGILRGLEDSTAKLQTSLPALSKVVASQSQVLGSALSHIVGGLVGGFSTFEPILDKVALSVERVSAKFEAFATGSGGAKFAQALASDYDKVAPIINDVAAAIGHIIEAAHGTGLGILTDLGILAHVISSFPTPVLTAIIDAFVLFRAAAAINGIAAQVGAAFTAMSAKVQTYGLANTLAATQAAAASAETIAAADAQAAAVLTARIAQTQAILASQEAQAAAAVATGSSLAAEAEATVAATRVEIAALETRAAVAVATAETSSAAALAAAEAQAAAAAQLAAAQRTAGAGFASALGPIGLVAAGLLILPSLFGNTDKSTQDATASIQTYTQALRDSSGAINDSVRSGVAKALSDDGAYQRAQKFGLTQDEVTTAVIKGGSAVDALSSKLYATARGHQELTTDAQILDAALRQEAKNFGAARQAAADQEAALIGAGSAFGVLGEAIKNGSTDIRAYVSAVKDFNSSADTAADRGKLIGEALRSANGDAISYQSTINATAKANQQLVTDFVNLKKGVLDLKTGTLDYHNAAAGPILQDLQSLQDANVKAAAAVYQHFVNTKGGAEAAGNAFDVYKKNTQGSLTEIGRNLGLTGTALKKFTEQYFGIKNAGDLKKKIELLGQDKVEAALKGILEDLDILVGKKPLIPINADGTPAQNTVDGLQRVINEIRQNRVPGLNVNTGAARDRINELQAEIDRLRGKRVDIVTVTRNEAGTATGRQVGSGSIAIATGGYIQGPGTGTSDSITARVSNGEFVVNAKQTKRNRGLLHAINDGAPGFASGGEVGGYTGVDYSGKAGNGAKRSSGGSSSSSSSASSSPNLTYVVDGKKYDTLKQAKKAAQDLFKVNVALGLKIDGSDLSNFRHSLKGTADEARTAFKKIYDDAVDLGISKGLAKQLRTENGQLVHEIDKRNKLADQYKATQDKYRALQASVKNAITGSFDITSAGKGFDGNQAVTGLNILAQSKQAEARVRLFVKDIKALKGRLNGTYLRQLLEQGPDALPQVEALLRLPKSQLTELNRSQAAINSQGAGLGTFAGETFYRGTLNSQAAGLRADDKQIDRLADRIADQFEHAADALAKRPVIIKADGREIARVVNVENKKSARRK